MIPLWPRLPQEFLWGSDLSGTLQGAGGVDGLLSMSERQPDESWQVSYAISDANGNVMKLVDSETLAMVAEYEYGPFGELLRAEGARAKANPFRFSSKYQDDESGLLYYGYRYYDAALGRWLSRDPIGEVGGENLYASAVNDLSNKVDAYGLDAIALADREVKWIPGDMRHYSLGYWKIPCGELVDMVEMSRAEFERRYPDAEHAGGIELLADEGWKVKTIFGTIVSIKISMLNRSDDSTDLKVVYQPLPEKQAKSNQAEVANMWRALTNSAKSYEYIEDETASITGLRRWPNSLYRLPWDSPPNNSNVFIRWLLNENGIGFNEMAGFHPPAISTPSEVDGSLYMGRPWK